MFLYQHHRLYRRKILITSFLLPVILMACYFAYRQMTPFGKSSLLTVDLGQQYVDFSVTFEIPFSTIPVVSFIRLAKGWVAKCLELMHITC